MLVWGKPGNAHTFDIAVLRKKTFLSLLTGIMNEFCEDRIQHFQLGLPR